MFNPMKKMTKRGWIITALAVVLLAGGTVAATLWGEYAYWCVRDTITDHTEAPAFHADWTPEEQEALLQWRHLVQWDFAAKRLKDEEKFAEFKSKVYEDWDLDIQRTRPDNEAKRQQRMLWAEVRAEYLRMVDEIISGGPSVIGSVCFELRESAGDTTVCGKVIPTMMAADMGATRALKVLVERGIDPDEGNSFSASGEMFEDVSQKDVPLAVVLTGGCRIGDFAGCEVAPRLAMADWLMEHGATFKAGNIDWGAIAFVASFSGEYEESSDCTEPLAWMIDHGAPVNDNMIWALFCRNGTLPIIQKLVEEKRLDLFNKNRGGCLMNVVDYYYMDDAVDKARYLLEAGVPVEGYPEGERDEEWTECQGMFGRPVVALQRLISDGILSPADADDKKQWENSLRLLELFISYGAQPDMDEDLLPEEPGLRARVQQILRSKN